MNLNDEVTVTLTDHGKNIVDEYIRELELETRMKFDNLYKYDKNGKLSMELWNLMSLFGKCMHIGKSQIFKDNEIELTETTKSKLIDLRDELYESMPCGTVNSFDLIKIIKAHIKKLDEIIDLE